MTVVRDNWRYPGSIGRMLEPIIPAVLEAGRNAPNDLSAAVRQNVRRVTRQLREEASPLLLTPQQEGKLKVVGAYYHLSSGEVDFFDG